MLRELKKILFCCDWGLINWIEHPCFVKKISSCIVQASIAIFKNFAFLKAFSKLRNHCCHREYPAGMSRFPTLIQNWGDKLNGYGAELEVSWGLKKRQKSGARFYSQTKQRFGGFQGRTEWTRELQSQIRDVSRRCNVVWHREGVPGSLCRCSATLLPSANMFSYLS